jgi:nucleoid-associated protein YgaU
LLATPIHNLLEVTMSLIKFLKDAGEKLFGGKDAKAAPASAPAAAPAATPAATAPNADERAAKAIEDYIRSQGLSASNLKVAFDGAAATVTVSGEAPDQQTREKIVLCCGNVAGVEQVKDEMTVTKSSETSRFYTVKSGDTLSKISKEMYGDANKYMKIFEANKPMLKDPDKIYPGQVLRVPA